MLSINQKVPKKFPPLPASRSTTPKRTTVSSSIPSSPQATFDRQLRRCMEEEDKKLTKQISIAK